MVQERIATAQWILERQLGWIGAADAKVAAVVAVDTALLAGLAAAVATAGSSSSKIAIAAAIGAFACAVVSIFFSAWAILPRTQGPSSLLFFGEISKFGCAEYAAKLRDVPGEEILLDWSQQIYRNAQIAGAKHKWVRRSMWCGFVAGLFWTVAVGLLVLP